MTKFTKKQYRELLNAKNIKWRHNEFHNRTRGYGDYLYHQDRDMFEDNYARHCEENGLEAQPRTDVLNLAQYRHILLSA